MAAGVQELPERRVWPIRRYARHARQIRPIALPDFNLSLQCDLCHLLYLLLLVSCLMYAMDSQQIIAGEIMVKRDSDKIYYGNFSLSGRNPRR